MSNAVKFAPHKPKLKKPATITVQLKKLKARGMIIDDEERAYRTLETINYYRLTHYFAVFLDESGKNYIKGTRFDNAIRLYDFDRKLRLEILAAVEEIEIAARAAISNYHSVRYGETGYNNAESFDRRHNHRMFANKIERIVKKNADLSFVRHHNKKYEGKFPLWVIMEMFSFGMLAVFYQDMKLQDKKEIADYYFEHDSRNVESWLDCLAILRNRCAHYNRIYGNPVPGIPRPIEIISPREYEMGTSLFDFLLTIKFLHKQADTWGKSFAELMEKLFSDYKDVAVPQVLGFPEDWQDFFTN